MRQRRTLYRKSNKFQKEDWEPEIKEEEEQRKKSKDLTRGQWILMMREIQRREATKEPGCEHREKIWFHDTHPQLLCKNCFVVLKERKINWNDVGYGF